MPSPGTVNNPAGSNSFDRFSPEPAYGEATQAEAFKQSAPLAGEAAAGSALDSPRRAKRQAGKPRPVQPGVVPGATVQASGVGQVAAFWQQVALAPGASELVKSLAAQASGQ